MSAESVRLSVNLSVKSAESITDLMDRKDVKLTEAVRRAIAVWKFVEDEVAAGNQLAVVEPDGTVRRLTLLDEAGERP